MVVLWGPNVWCWKSGRQSLTAASTSEAELLGANHEGEALKAMHLALSEMMGISLVLQAMWMCVVICHLTDLGRIIP
eukprot:5696752-Amphidinium_carterae.2